MITKTKKHQNKKTQLGFTLVEVVVAIGIFSLASVIISTVYFNTNNLHQQTANFQRLQNEGRYLVEKIAREVRAREITYPIDSPPPQNHLEFLKDEFTEHKEECLTKSGLSVHEFEMRKDHIETKIAFIPSKIFKF